MADHPTNETVTVVGAICTAAGVVGKSIVDRYRNRDKLGADQAADMIGKLWEQNKELGAKVDECRKHHTECQEQNARMEERLIAQGERLDELTKRLGYQDLME